MTWNTELWTLIRKGYEVGDRFTIEDVYAWEEYMASLYPNNRHVRETMRDKLQEFRDLDLIKFVDDEGTYERVA